MALFSSTEDELFLKPEQERLSIAVLTSGLEEGVVGGLKACLRAGMSSLPSHLLVWCILCATPEVPPGSEMLPFSFPSLFIVLVAGHQQNLTKACKRPVLTEFSKMCVISSTLTPAWAGKAKPEL